jgi:hypothetical protein
MFSVCVLVTFITYNIVPIDKIKCMVQDGYIS